MVYRILAFDSGIGGLAIVSCLRQQLAVAGISATIDFLADNGGFPYGEQADNFLIKRIVTIIGQAIKSLNPDIIVIACNTASTVALDTLRKHYPLTAFVGCVPPIRWAARISKTRHIGLLATRATVRRPYLYELQKQFAADCQLIAYGSATLATIAENVFRKQNIDLTTISNELEMLFKQPEGQTIDTICLGCTHYTFILDELKYFSPPQVQWLDPAGAVARHTIDLLQTNSLGSSSTQTASKNHFFFTASSSNKKNLLDRLYPLGYQDIEDFKFEESSH